MHEYIAVLLGRMRLWIDVNESREGSKDQENVLEKCRLSTVSSRALN